MAEGKKSLSASGVTRFALKLLVSVALLFFIFYFIGAAKIYEELRKSDGYYISLAILLAAVQIFFKAARWGSITGIFRSRISLLQSYLYTLMAHSLGIITPGRLGEFVKAKFLVDRTGISYVKSFATVILDKILDVVTVVLFVLAGLAFIGFGAYNREYFAVAFAIFLLFLILFLIFFDKAKKLMLGFIPKKYRLEFVGNKLQPRTYAMLLLYSALIWLTLSMQGFFVSEALYMDLPFFVVLTLVPLMAISSMIPISIGGIGVREIIAIYFFQPFGVPAEKAALFSLIYTFVSFAVPAIGGAILYAFKKK